MYIFFSLFLRILGPQLLISKRFSNTQWLRYLQRRRDREKKREISIIIKDIVRFWLIGWNVTVSKNKIQVEMVCDCSGVSLVSVEHPDDEWNFTTYRGTYSLVSIKLYTYKNIHVYYFVYTISQVGKYAYANWLWVTLPIKVSSYFCALLFSSLSVNDVWVENNLLSNNKLFRRKVTKYLEKYNDCCHYSFRHHLFLLLWIVFPRRKQGRDKMTRI